MITPKWKDELKRYLNDNINNSLRGLKQKYGDNVVLFIEHNKPDRIFIYYSRKYIINSDGSYNATGEKILYTEVDISQYNKKTNKKTRFIQNSYVINEVIKSFYNKNLIV